MTDAEETGAELDATTLFSLLTGRGGAAQRAALNDHLLVLDAHLRAQAAAGQTSGSWDRLQAALTAVRLAREILERLPAQTP